MKLFRFFILAVLVSGGLSAAEIPAGVRVLLRVQNSVSSRTAKTGDSVFLTTATPIAVNGRVVVPVGSQVSGIVTSTRRSASFHRQGELGIVINTLVLASGTAATLSGRIVSVDPGWNGQQATDGSGTITRVRVDPLDRGEIDHAAFGTVTGALAIGGVAGALTRSETGFAIGTAAAFGGKLLLLAARRGRDVEIRPQMMMEAVFDGPVTIGD